MAVQKMKLVNILGPISLVDEAISKLCVNNNFHPESINDVVQNTKGFFPFDTANPYTQPLKKVTEILNKSGITPELRNFSSLNMNHSEINRLIDDFETSLGNLTTQLEKNEQQIKDNDQIMLQIRPIINTNITFEQLFNLEYIKFRFGRIPLDSFEILVNNGIDNTKYLYVISSKDKQYVWLMYFVPRQYEDRIDSLFASLHFERIRISDKVNGTPAETILAIENEQKKLYESNEKITKQINKFAKENKETLLLIYSKLKYESEAFEIRKYASHTNDSFYITGWIPEDMRHDFELKAEKLGISCIFEDPCDSLPTPPTKLKNIKLLKPFEEFVKMYGMPLYNEIDPTPLVAITYTMIFGLMFGDLGQGLVLALAGFALWLFKKVNLGRIIGICGLSSMLFGGVLYGTVFGYEDFLPGLKPLHNETHFYIALGGSIIIGVTLLLISMIINVINGIKQRNIEKALFSNNGIAGIVFYFSALLIVISMFLLNIDLLTLPFLSIFIIAPLLIIFFKEPLSHAISKHKEEKEKLSKTEFFLQNFFELFEVVLSYITNTISFVRIGAFALNHAGLMMFVFILSRMSGSSDNIFILIIGNLFVILLEGLIVGIQVLRLQFYELFSHFYSGDGKPFEAFTINFKK